MDTNEQQRQATTWAAGTLSSRGATTGEPIVDAGSEDFRAMLNRVIDRAYNSGFKAGKKIGHVEGFNMGDAAGRTYLKRAQDRALGIGVLIGSGIGLILAMSVAAIVSGAPA